MHVLDLEQWMINGVMREDLFGYGEPNEAGEELLSFLATNEATVCNTWFMKKNTKTNLATSQVSEVALY